MTRMSKQGERRNKSPRRPKMPSPKTGSKKDNLAAGHRTHENIAPTELALSRFIPKIS